MTSRVRAGRARGLALALTLGVTSCAEHPALTVGVATGSIAFGSCEVDVQKVGTCGVVGGIAGVAFGLITAVIYHFTDSNAHQLPPDDELGSDGTVRLHTFTLPPPVPLGGTGPGSGSGSGGAPGALPPVTMPAPVPAPAPVDAGIEPASSPSDAGM